MLIFVDFHVPSDDFFRLCDSLINFFFSNKFCNCSEVFFECLFRTRLQMFVFED